MAVAADGNSGGAAIRDTTMAWTHNVASGSDRYMTVVVAVEQAGSISSVDIAGNNFTFLRTDAVGSSVDLEIWYLLETNFPATGNQTVTVTPDAKRRMTGGSSGYSGVDQSTFHQTQATEIGNGTTQNVSVVTSADNYVYAVMGSNEQGTDAIASGETERANFNEANKASILLMDQVGFAGTREMDSTMTTSGLDWRSTGISLAAAAGVTTTDYTRPSDTRITILDNEYTRPSNSRIKLEPSDDYTRPSNSRILIVTDYTRTSNSRIQTLGTDYTRPSIAAIQRLGFDTKDLTSQTLIINTFVIEPLSNTRIKFLDTDYTRPSNSRIVILDNEYTRPSNTRVKKEAIQDYTRPSNTAILLITDYTRPSDTKIIVVTDYTRTANSRILNTTELQMSSGTQIAGGGLINITSNTAIFVAAFADYTRPADTAIQVIDNEYTRPAETRILATTDLTQQSNSRIQTTDEITKLSDTRIQVLAQEVSPLSNARVLTTTDYTRPSNTQIAAGVQSFLIDLDSDTRIKKSGLDYTRTSNTRIGLPTVVINLTSGSSIKREGFVDQSQLSDVRIQIPGNDYTRTSNSRIQIIDQEVAHTSIARILTESNLLDVLSSTRLKVLDQPIDVLSDTKIILSFEIESISEVRIKATTDYQVLSGTKIATSLEGLKILLTSGTKILLPPLNITDIKAKVRKIHAIRSEFRRIF